MIDGSLTNARH